VLVAHCAAKERIDRSAAGPAASRRLERNDLVESAPVECGRPPPATCSTQRNPPAQQDASRRAIFDSRRGRRCRFPGSHAARSANCLRVVFRIGRRRGRYVYWNRYPGRVRLPVSSTPTRSPGLAQEWEWSEKVRRQPRSCATSTTSPTARPTPPDIVFGTKSPTRTTTRKTGPGTSNRHCTARQTRSVHGPAACRAKGAEVRSTGFPGGSCHVTVAARRCDLAGSASPSSHRFLGLQSFR